MNLRMNPLPCISSSHFEITRITCVTLFEQKSAHFIHHPFTRGIRRAALSIPSDGGEVEPISLLNARSRARARLIARKYSRGPETARREQKSIRKCLFVARNNIVLVIHGARVQPVGASFTSRRRRSPERRAERCASERTPSRLFRWEMRPPLSK